MYHIMNRDQLQAHQQQQQQQQQQRLQQQLSSEQDSQPARLREQAHREYEEMIVRQHGRQALQRQQAQQSGIVKLSDGNAAVPVVYPETIAIANQVPLLSSFSCAIDPLCELKTSHFTTFQG
jgi:hypothetical protein